MGTLKAALAAAGALACVMVLSGCVNPPNMAPREPAPIAQYTPEAPDIPAGFKDQGNGLATTWLDHDDPAFDCSYYDQYSILRVYAYGNCPSMVYVAANILDSSKRVVGFTNDTLPSLREGQEALMTLGIMETNGTSVQVSEVNCY